MKKSDLDFVNAAAKIKNRVAVKDYYFDSLPQDLRRLAFTVSNLEALSQVNIIKQSLENARREGLSFYDWKNQLDTDAVRNLSRSRLETVYRTNMSSVYGQSTRFNAATSNVTPYLMFSAVGDSRTRVSHLELDGIIKRADSPFWDKYTPPLGYNCYAHSQKISGKYDRGFRAFYRGPMLKITTENGKIISGITPNHPIMTSEGFVFAKKINVGDDLVGNNREIKGLNISTDKEDYDSVTTAGDAFNSFLSNGFSIVKSSSFNFYGDIKFMNKNVHVMTRDGELPRANIMLADFIKKFFFIFSFNRACVSSVSSGCQSSSVKINRHILQDVFNESIRNIQLFCNVLRRKKLRLIESFAFALNKFNVFSEKRLSRNVSCFDSSGAKPIVDRVSADPELLTKFENAKSFIVETDKVVNVEVYPYFGFVYDFESVHGLVVADGIITSNCRCTTIPISTQEAKRRGISRKSLDNLPEPDSGFGGSPMGDVNAGANERAQQAINSLPINDPFRAKFQNAQDNIENLVDVWWQSNQNKFK